MLLHRDANGFVDEIIVWACVHHDRSGLTIHKFYGLVRVRNAVPALVQHRGLAPNPARDARVQVMTRVVPLLQVRRNGHG